MLTDSALRARRTDPITSHRAAVRAERFAASHAGRIDLALAGYGPATAHELSELTGLSVVQIDRRLPDLAKAGRARVQMFGVHPMVRGGARVWEAV